MKHYLTSLHTQHAAFLSLLALFTAFRALAALFLQPGGFFAPFSPDQAFYHAIGSLSATDLYPYLDYWVEFPPLFPWLIVAAYRLSLLIPAWWYSNMLWFNVVLRLLMLPFEVASLSLIYAIATHLYGQQTGQQAATAFALLFAPLFAFLGWFDSLVLFSLLLGLYGLAKNSPTLTALGLGLGFGLKLFPLAMLPAALRAFTDTRRLLTLLTVTALCLLLVFGPFLLLTPDFTLAFFRTLAGRASWETIWALLDGYHSYGAVAPLSIRNDPASAAWLPPDVAPSSLPWPWIALAFAALGLFLWTRPIAWPDPRRSLSFAALTFGLMLLYGRGYSPQWGIYPATLAVTLLPDKRGLLYGITFSALTAFEWPLAFTVFNAVPGFLTAVILARTALTVILCLEFAAQVYPTSRWLALTAQRLPALTALGMLLAGLIGLAPAYTAYRASRLAGEPLAPLITAWQQDVTTRQTILASQPVMVERLHSLLPPHVSLHTLPNAFGQSWLEPQVWLDHTVTAAPWQVIWFLQDTRQTEYAALNARIDGHLSQITCKLWDEQYGSDLASAYLALHPTPDTPIRVSFGQALTLTDYGLASSDLPTSSAWCLTLQWIAFQPLDRDYVVLIRLHDHADRLRYEHRLGPVGGTQPTSTWQPNRPVEDAHGLLAPLPPGRYTLSIALLDPQTGQTLPADGPARLTEVTTVK